MLDWILALAIATFLCVIAFLYWNKASTAAKERGPHINDPQSTSGNLIRPPEELRASLDTAANRSVV